MGFDMPNLSFLAQFPLALWGLLALLIPLAIHLLSKSRVQIVPFAHLALITVKTSPRLRQLRITQWLLLFLRLLLLLLATLIVAELYWQSNTDTNTKHILVTEDWLNHANDGEKNQLIQQSSGSKLTLIARPNAPLGQQQITQWQKSTSEANALNLWEKVADFRAELSSQSQVSVYSTNRLSQFLGSKQDISSNVNWQIKSLPTSDTTSSIQATVLVLFDKPSTPTLAYLKAAFDALNTSKQISLNVQYMDLAELTNITLIDLSVDKIIHLSRAEIPDIIASKQANLVTREQLGAIQQPEFPLILFDLLFAQQQDNWRFQNTLLSEQQITVSAANDHAELERVQPSNASGQSLHLWLILFLVIVFAAERVLSEWRFPQKPVAVDN